MSCKKSFISTIVVSLLYTFLFYNCQQSLLNVVEDDATETFLQEQIHQAKPSAAEPTTHALSSVVLTSSSDSSPDAKNANLAASDHNATAKPMANILQNNALASASADTTIAKASGEVARKRPATAKIDNHKEKKLATTKKAKKELDHQKKSLAIRPKLHPEQPCSVHRRKRAASSMMDLNTWFETFVDAIDNIEDWKEINTIIHQGATQGYLDKCVEW